MRCHDVLKEGEEDLKVGAPSVLQDLCGKPRYQLSQTLI